MQKDCVLFKRDAARERGEKAQRLFNMQTWGMRSANVFLYKLKLHLKVRDQTYTVS